MAFQLFPKAWRRGAFLVLLFALAAPALSQQVGRGINVTVYESPT